MLVLSFKNDKNDPTRDYFGRCYKPLVEMKDCKQLIDNKPFFDQPVKKTRRIWKTNRNVKKRMTIQQEV